MNKPAERHAEIRMSLSASRKLVSENPGDADVDSIYHALQTLREDPWVGDPVPFASSDLKGIFVLKTRDGKWLIVYRVEGSKTEPSEAKLLQIVELIRADDV
jgi:hypothetical protein